MQGNLNLKYALESDMSFIFCYFEDFYAEIIRQKSLVAGVHSLEHAQEIGVGSEKLFIPDMSPPVKAEGEEVAPKTLPTEVQLAAVPEQIIQTLISLLSSQAMDAARFGGEFAAKYYQEAEFIMSALADEIFLHLDWTGKDYWEKNLLEDRLYGTHNAGQTFFDKIDEFLAIRDVSRGDLAMLYLLALGLGFQGKYRGRDDEGKLAHYRRELYIFIYHRDPTLFNLGATMFPEIYQHTIEDNQVELMSDVRPWVFVFIATGIALLVASFMVWTATTYSIDQFTSSITKLSKEGREL